MKAVVFAVRRFLADEEGAHGVEYALIAGLVGIGFVAGASALGVSLNGFLNNVSLCINAPSLATCSVPFGGGGGGGAAP